MNPQAAIVGYGQAYAEKAEFRPPITLAAESIREAVNDAGLGVDEIRGEGLLTVRRPAADHRPQWNNALASYLNLAPRFTSEITFHSAGAISMIEYASRAVREGWTDYVVCAGADASASLGSYPLGAEGENYTEFVSTLDVHPEFEYPYGAVMPATFGMAARHQMQERDHTEEQFAHVSVICRDWGVDHPYATLGNEGRITIEDVLDSRMIASPIRLLNIMPLGPAGAGGAVIVTTPERAETLSEDPIYIEGYGSKSTHEHLLPRMNSKYWGKRGNLVDTGLSEAADQAFSMTDLSHEDIDTLHSSTSTSNRTPLMLEELGFCDPGDGGAFIDDGNLDPDGGRIAFNTDGGALTGGQVGVSLYLDRLIECIRQLRREPLGRQAEDAVNGVVYATGGPLYACNTLSILSNGGHNR